MKKYRAWVIKDNRFGDYVTSIGNLNADNIEHRLGDHIYSDPDISNAKVYRYKPSPFVSNGEFLLDNHPNLDLQEVEITIRECE